MASWTKQIEEHPVHMLITTTAEVILSAAKGIDDADAVENLARLGSVTATAKKVISESDPHLVSKTVLDQWVQSLSQIKTQVEQYENNKDPGHLTNANNHADNFLIQINSIYRPITKKDVQSVNESVSSFRKSAGQHLRHLEKQKDGLEKSIELLTKKQGELNTKLESQISTLETTIAEIQKKLTAFENQRNAIAEAAEVERQNQFQTNLEERSNQFQKLVETTNTSTEKMISNLTKRIKAIQSKANNDITKYFDELNELKKDAENLVFVISNTGMAGGYQRIANQERIAAYVWRITTVLSIGGIIYFAIMAFEITLAVEFELTRLLARAFVASTFGILGGYSARQASKHFERERYHRRMELEIASIDPFIAGLPEDQRNKVKESLTDKLFGQQVLPLSSEKGEEFTGSILDILKMAVEALTRKLD